MQAERQKGPIFQEKCAPSKIWGSVVAGHFNFGTQRMSAVSMRSIFGGGPTTKQQNMNIPKPVRVGPRDCLHVGKVSLFMVGICSLPALPLPGLLLRMVPSPLRKGGRG